MAIDASRSLPRPSYSNLANHLFASSRDSRRPIIALGTCPSVSGSSLWRLQILMQIEFRKLTEGDERKHTHHDKTKPSRQLLQRAEQNYRHPQHLSTSFSNFRFQGPMPSFQFREMRF